MNHMRITPNTTLVDFIPTLIRIFDFLILISTGVFAIYIIVTAIKMSLSQGDSKGLQAAKGTLTYAIAGFLVILLFFTIVRFLLLFAGQSNTYDSPNAPFNTLQEALERFNRIILNN